MSIETLWDDLQEATITLPIDIIEKAIKGFNKKTADLNKNLRFELRINPYQTSSQIISHSLYLNAPDLGGYSMLVLATSYNISDVYPCTLTSYLGAEKEIISCDSDTNFEEELVKLLDSMKSIVSKLLAQCPPMDLPF